MALPKSMGTCCETFDLPRLLNAEAVVWESVDTMRSTHLKHSRFR